MKNLVIAALALALVTGSAFAQDHMKGNMMKGQGHMKGHDMKGHMSSADALMMKTAMAGMSKGEMATAMAFGQKLTPAQHAVMMKRCSMCMHDKHAGMDMSKMNDKKGMAHMMSGLSRSEQMTMKGMWGKMSPKEMAVCKKMAVNCCMYGMKHGK